MGIASIFFGRAPIAVARSLAADPSAWSRSNYMLHHVSGFSLWIANRPYGAEIERDSISVWGGVSFLSTFGLSPGHHLLNAAIRRWERTAIGSIEDALAPSIPEKGQ